jgi:hypothetical protein
VSKTPPWSRPGAGAERRAFSQAGSGYDPGVTPHVSATFASMALAAVLMLRSGWHKRLLERRDAARCASCGRPLRRGACDACVRGV